MLYFPKIKNNLDIRKDRIQLYCNRVFVTDSVEGVVPDFLMLLQGVIDSPDIPLNVSRSYLQSDARVKQISSYITKKVSSRLAEIAKNDAKAFEEKWNDIKIFIEYGMLTDEKFCDAALKFMLLEDTDGKFFKLDDYKKLIESTQTDKDGNLVVLYATDKEAQYTYIKAAADKGYNVLMMNGQLDSAFIGTLEQKVEKSHFVRVDSDVIDNLIKKDNAKEADITAMQRNVLTTVFRSQIPAIEKAEFTVAFAALGEEASPVVVTQSEYMRRMKEMAALQPGMSFYGEFPDNYIVTLNTEHRAVRKVMDAVAGDLNADVQPLEDELTVVNSEIKAIRDTDKDHKGLPDDKQKEVEEKEKRAQELRNKESEIATNWANNQATVKQLIDIALLSNGLLKGEALNNFLKRSIDLL